MPEMKEYTVTLQAEYVVVASEFRQAVGLVGVLLTGTSHACDMVNVPYFRSSKITSISAEEGR